jgi:hypothetical protein
MANARVGPFRRSVWGFTAEPECNDRNDPICGTTAVMDLIVCIARSVEERHGGIPRFNSRCLACPFGGAWAPPPARRAGARPVAGSVVPGVASPVFPSVERSWVPLAHAWVAFHWVEGRVVSWAWCRRISWSFSARSVHASWCLCLPSRTSSTSLALKAGRSFGVRLVTRPWSTTTSRSSQCAPALIRSVLMLL